MTNDSLIESIKHHAEMILKYPGQCDYEASEILTLIRNYQDASRPKDMLGFPIPKTLDDLRKMTLRPEEKP